MRLQSRVEKLENDARVPQPCWFCGLVGRATRIFYDYLNEHGAELPEAVYETRVCRYCGAVKRTDITGLTPEDLALDARFHDALDAEDGEAAERLIAEFEAVCLARGVAAFGEHYVGASAAADEYIGRWFDENADKLKEAA